MKIQNDKINQSLQKNKGRKRRKSVLSVRFSTFLSCPYLYLKAGRNMPKSKFFRLFSDKSNEIKPLEYEKVPNSMLLMLACPKSYIFLLYYYTYYYLLYIYCYNK